MTVLLRQCDCPQGAAAPNRKMLASSRAQVPAIRQAWLACCSRTNPLLPLEAGKPTKLRLWLHNSWRRPASSLPWLWSSRHSSSLCRRWVEIEQMSSEMQQVFEMRVTMPKYVGMQGALCVTVLGECRQQQQWVRNWHDNSLTEVRWGRCASHSVARQSACS